MLLYFQIQRPSGNFWKQIELPSNNLYCKLVELIHSGAGA